MENTYRDVNIAIANEFARLAARFGINVWEAIQIANRHPRVEILRPGPGVGGHCISVDPWFLVEVAPALAQLIRQARNVNDGQPAYVVAGLQARFGSLEDKTFAVLGVTFKANVDDTRESPAIDVIHHLQQAGAQVRAFDPHVKQCHELGAALVGALSEALDGADGVLLLVDHREFETLDAATLGTHLRQRWILDTRNMLDRAAWVDAGFEVALLGKNQ